jgi:hypothetical protein
MAISTLRFEDLDFDITTYVWYYSRTESGVR